MPFELFAEIFRFICLIAFVWFVISVLRKSKKSDYDKAGRLPLESEFGQSDETPTDSQTLKAANKPNIKK